MTIESKGVAHSILPYSILPYRRAKNALMSINPATLALAIPVVSKVASATIDVMGQAVSFRKLFAQENTAAIASGSGEPSLRQQLDSLSQNLRKWLAEQGVHTPYEIRLSSIDADSKSDLSVQGVQGDTIRNLLAQEPDRLTGLKRIASSIQAFSSTLASGEAGLSITDTDSRIIY